MKIGVISDSHGYKFECEPVDVFCHCGDTTARGTYAESIALAEYMKENIKTTHIILCPGNHDLCYEEDLPTMKHDLKQIDERIEVLVNEEIVIDGIRFYCSPFTPIFFDWAFMQDEAALEKTFSKIPQDVDVLITHGPPHGILDPGHRQDHAGSTALLHAVTSRNIKHHFFGHLHGSGGHKNHMGDTTFYNVAMVDDRYKVKRGPFILEIEESREIQAEFKGDKAKLRWSVSLDGKKTQSETYKILAVMEKKQ